MELKEIEGSARVRSVDIIRGAVMVLMVIDHVRVYSGLPAGGQEPGIFFTRWVTHFCAPAFVFFAGTGAFFYGRKLNNLNSLSRFLLTRGLLLVVLELTLIRLTWTFNLNYAEFVLAGVIWMIGWCMVLLALLVRFKPSTVGITGLIIIFFQQLFAFVPRGLPESIQQSVGPFWEFIYSSGFKPWPPISVLYVLVPWIGVMASGYGFGTILILDPKKRDRICLTIGLSAIVLFLIGGSIMILAKETGPNSPPFIFRLLSQQKYPASQLFLLMTLGPAIALIPFAERSRGAIADALTLFGRIPFFFYLLHIPLIHISALVVNLIRDGATHQDLYTYAPFTSVPEPLRWNLPLLYLTFSVDVVILYFACRSYARYKFSHPGNRWLKYI